LPPSVVPLGLGDLHVVERLGRLLDRSLLGLNAGIAAEAAEVRVVFRVSARLGGEVGRVIAA
jgi:hypothetical protein